MAAIAASPSGLAIILSVAVLMEFNPCLASDGEPVTIMLANTSTSLDILLIFSFETVMFLKNGIINIISEMYWLSMVAMPAPDIPKLNPNMSIGS